MIGGEDSSYGFLEYLLTQNDISFTNLSLVLCGECSTLKQNLNDIRSQMLLFKSNIVSDNKNGDYLQKLCAENQVQIIQDHITALDVSHKRLTLKESGDCLYDVLIFANGLGAVNLIPSPKYFTAGSKFKGRTSFDDLMLETIKYTNILRVSPQNAAQIKAMKRYFAANDHMLSRDGDLLLVEYKFPLNFQRRK